MGMPPDYEIGRLTSNELTEVRTVLSRAETALAFLNRHPEGELELEPMTGHWEIIGTIRGFRGGTYQDKRWVIDTQAVTIRHPDLEEMRDALTTTVASLRKWARTGAKRRPK
ncbi:hypothetical protein GCM10009765_58820 [Fodinicola feengrottensis]|uniref:Uncharacterized protein n=1 Tax=Fodinicola feengrottensis TaxID=435914 RepID=A0ABN2IAW1_9ACTN